MEQPLVSIIIPTYKRPDTLDRAINSVLNQTYKNIEVIVVDDNNPDTEGRRLTIEKMKEFENNPLVKYIMQPQNMNGSVARNTGARVSKGEYIGFLDDDDEFLPGKIESQLKRFSEVPEEYAVCYSRYYTIKPGGERHLASETREGNQYLNALTRELSFQAGSNMLIKRKAFEDIHGFDETFIRSQDKEIVARLLKKYRICCCQTPGLVAYLHYNHNGFDPIKITDYYEEKMKAYIDELSPEDRAYYNRGMANQRFYYSFSRKRYGYAMKILFSGKLPICDAWNILLKGFVSKYFKK